MAGLTKLTYLLLDYNDISDLSPLAGLTQLRYLWLRENTISDLSPLAGLTNLTELDLRENPLNTMAFETHIPAHQSRGTEVLFDKPPLFEFTLSVPKGISLIHVPLKVTVINGEPRTVESIGDLYDALGGAETVSFLISLDSNTQEWSSYFGPQDKGTPSDKVLTDDLGIIATLIKPVSVQFTGEALGTNRNSAITLRLGTNLVGVPVKDSRITRVSDLLTLDGIEGNVSTIIVNDTGEFFVVGRAGDAGNIPITDGQSFLLIARASVTVPLTGEGWGTLGNQ